MASLLAKFAGGVGPHAVGHHEQVAPLPPGGRAGGDHHGQRVLVIRAAEPQVAERGVFQAALPTLLCGVHNLPKSQGIQWPQEGPPTRLSIPILPNTPAGN